MADGRPFHSKDARIIIGTTTLGQLNAYSLNINTDTVETDEFEEDWKRNVPGQSTWSGDVSGWVYADKRVLMDAVTGQAALALFLYPDSADTSNYFSGTAVFTSWSGSGSASSAAALTANFVGDGELARVGFA